MFFVVCGCCGGVCVRVFKGGKVTVPKRLRELFGVEDGDYVHIQDVVEANMLALKNKGIVGETFNIATGIATTINQLANVLSRITRKTHLKMVHSKPRKGDIKHSVADISKARKKLHYDPKVLLKDGLKELTKS